ncbi:transposase [Halioxenophilus aromaticivorans]|uniref:Transposase n=1 Tax=Halioxenophilus aromaticivorans TaxID=1306992 RepID=A0AAV3U1H0_9ALTE
MARARNRQVSLEVTPYYHCTSRCVRRAFLCGEDAYTGESYEHRRQWVEDRLLELASVFTIDICAYAVMSNHLHVVLHVDTQLGESLSDREVCERWHQLYKGTLLTQRYLNGEALNRAQMDAVSDKLDDWRSQLQSISWFMRALNEPIARRANAEDGCKGRFWEGRFTSQALLDEKALLACMAYVDLNPIRAKMADKPENSDHTSIQRRINSLKKNKAQPEPLAPFIGSLPQDEHSGIPFELGDYLELVDWTGRVMRADKRGYVEQSLPPILQRLSMSNDRWLELAQSFEDKTSNLAGCHQVTKLAAQILGYQRVPAIAQNRRYFG